jgi:hypothetical protein
VASAYSVGDIITYHDAEMNANIIALLVQMEIIMFSKAITIHGLMRIIPLKMKSLASCGSMRRN